MINWNKYPYTDFHELNLDWLIELVQELHKDWDEFQILNNIRFFGKWKITEQYPAFAIVSDDNNVGYISKKIVPAGVTLDNIDYWTLVADYSEILAGIQERVVELERTVNTGFTTVNEHLGQLDNSIGNITPRVESLETDVNTLKIKGRNRNVILIGDSYADTNRGGFSKGWFTTFATFSNIPASNIHGYQRGGAGYVGAGQGVTFENLADTAIAELVAIKDTITDIVIAGGCNDANANITVQQINGAKDIIFGKLHAAFPNAIIRTATIGGFRSYEQRVYLTTRVEYVIDYPSVGYVKPILNARLPMCLGSNFDTDGIHPNHNGVLHIGRLLGTAVVSDTINGVFDNGLNAQISLTAKTGYSFGSNNAIRMAAVDNYIKLSSRGRIDVNGTFNVTFNTGVTATFATTGETTIAANTTSATAISEQATIPAIFEFYVTGTEGYEIPGELKFHWDGSNMNVSIYCPTAVKSFNASLCRIKPFSVDIHQL